MKKIVILSCLLIMVNLSVMANAGELSNEILLAKKETAVGGNSPSEIILTSKERSGATNRDGTGLYWDIIRAIYAPIGVRPKFVIRSQFGSVTLIKNEKADAMVGTFQGDIKDILLPKYPLAKELLFVVFKKEKLNQWEGIESIKGKRVAWINGFHFDRYLDVPVEKNIFAARDQILQLLETDRIDYFVDTQNELEAALNNRKLDLTSLTAEILMNIDLYLAFANNEKGIKLRDIFNYRFPKLVESGEIENLFVKWNGN